MERVENSEGAQCLPVLSTSHKLLMTMRTTTLPSYIIFFPYVSHSNLKIKTKCKDCPHLFKEVLVVFCLSLNVNRNN